MASDLQDEYEDALEWHERCLEHRLLTCRQMTMDQQVYETLYRGAEAPIALRSDRDNLHDYIEVLGREIDSAAARGDELRRERNDARSEACEASLRELEACARAEAAEAREAAAIALLDRIATGWGALAGPPDDGTGEIDETLCGFLTDLSSIRRALAGEKGGA